MDPRTLTDNVIVVGGGPAGSAVAICCAMRGLRTTLVEREPFPRERPGETLHALAQEIFGYLGVLERVVAEGLVRTTGSWIGWTGAPTFHAFGDSDQGPLRGFQAPGDVLDAILLERAREVGVEIRQPCDALGVIVDGDRVCGVETATGPLRATWVIDAAGRRHWLARRRDIPVDRASPQLLAYFGYATGACPPLDFAPVLRADADGWTWMARIAEGRYHWTRLAWRRDETARRPPPEFVALEQVGSSRAIDVTWRRVRAAAGPGYWCVGDAAAVVDPAGSHGVIRALMAGIHVAESCTRIASGVMGEADAIGRYQSWVDRGFIRDTTDLRAKYCAVAGGEVWSS